MRTLILGEAMTENEYIEATNLAKVRIADEAMQSVIARDPITEDKRLAITKLLGDMLQECYDHLETRG